MIDESGASRSPWMARNGAVRSETLSNDADADVCVIGAGISGLSVAYSLAREGRSVIVVDDGAIGRGDTSRTTAHLSSVIDDGFASIEKLHGVEGARGVYRSHAAAIDRIEAIARENSIDCGFQRVDGILAQADGVSPDALRAEFAAATRAGIAVEQFASSPIEGLALGACLRFADQAQMHPLRYLDGLAAAFVRLGGRLYSDAHVLAVLDGEPARVEVNGGRTVTARSVVVATNSPVTTLFAMHTKQSAYRTFVIGAACPRGSVPQVLLWDNASPYHYARLVPGRGLETAELLIVGGEDHKTGQADDAEQRYAGLETWMRRQFPLARQVEFRWSGQVLETLDGLAYIGREPGTEHVYLATGDSGMGMTHGTIAGMLITDLIVGRENPWKDLYAPDRKPLGAAREFVRENLNVAAQFVDLVKPGQVASADEIPRGSGAIVRRGIHLVAAHRDDDGSMHELSAICTHLGGVVHWNSAERSWDCPCHGTRYAIDGRVLNGPASQPLADAQHDDTVSANAVSARSVDA
ncbi:MAG: FAD-dependent oxidoreductase [Planctomycetes bacterium]|nr:FAD-dependent oxidoreductase [Planctomycetota bacterium]